MRKRIYVYGIVLTAILTFITVLYVRNLPQQNIVHAIVNCPDVMPPADMCPNGQSPVRAAGSCTWTCPALGCSMDSECASGEVCVSGSCSIPLNLITLTAGQETFLNMYNNADVGTMYDNLGKITVTYKTVGAGSATLQRKTYWVTGSVASTTTFTLAASTASYSTVTLGSSPMGGWIGPGAATLKLRNAGSNTIQITNITVYGIYDSKIMGVFPRATCGSGAACTEGNICYQNTCKQGCSTDMNCPSGYRCDTVACVSVPTNTPTPTPACGNALCTNKMYPVIPVDTTKNAEQLCVARGWGHCAVCNVGYGNVTIHGWKPDTGSWSTTCPGYALGAFNPVNMEVCCTSVSSSSSSSSSVPPTATPTPTTPPQTCITATEDAYIEEGSQVNYGGSTQIKAGTFYTDSLKYYLGYVKFNPAQIPANYTKAIFKVYQADTYMAAGGLPVNLYRVTGAWGESTIKWSNKPAYDGTSWGSQNLGDSFSKNTWYSWDVTARLKTTAIPNGFVLADSRYNPSCDGNTGAMCRAGAYRAGYLNSKEVATNKPQLCFEGSSSGSSSSSSSANYAPTATPYPTARPDKANLYFRVKMPDIAPGVAAVAQVRVQVRDGVNPVTETVTTLNRIDGGYFRTLAPLELNIPAGAAKMYTLNIKQLKTVRRSFTALLQRGATTDCIAADSSCGGGTLGSSGAPGKELLSGDSDGFNDGSNGTPSSVSFNRIDATDLQRIVDGYGAATLPAEPNADFNLDGKIDVYDLGILGKNYGKYGE